MPSDTIKRNNATVIGDGPKVLLYAHGFGCSQSMWDRITPAFRSSHRQVLFDYVGSGRSDLTAFDPVRYSTLGGYAQDVLDVCDALELHEGVVFVGHSVSCSIGILVSILRPGLFSRMVLLGPNPCFVNDPAGYIGGFERSDLEGLLDLMDQNYIGWANYLAPIVSAQAEDGEVTAELSHSFCSTDPIAAGVFAKATFFSDDRHNLPNVTCPSLIIQHRHDALAPVSVGEFMHSQMPDSTLHVIDVSGHCGHMSHPELVISAMRDFIDPGP